MQKISSIILDHVVENINSMCSTPIMRYKDADYDRLLGDAQYPNIVSRIPSSIITELLEHFSDNIDLEQLYFSKINIDPSEGLHPKIDIRFSTKYVKFMNDNSKLLYKFNQYLNREVLKGSSYYNPMNQSLISIFNPKIIIALFKIMERTNWLRDTHINGEMGTDLYLKSIERLTESELDRHISKLMSNNESIEVLGTAMNCYYAYDLGVN